METFLQQLNFDLDPFQKEAIEVISQGHSVVVCAPTGSGKTIIAEYAALKAIERGCKLFYTTPLKALSNQKFFDFRRQYGEQNVGLLTGDISINREARILVMTTEVFRNMLYGINDDRTLLNDIGYVVLDECHFMNDAERGTVWEESIIYCPESIQIIALSATVANADELTNWINEVHHDTRLISSDFRPVPLRFSYYTREKLLPLFEAPGKMNQKLKFDIQGNRFAKNVKVFRPNDLIKELQQREMLPAIFFTFSRRGCDSYLKDTRNLSLLTPDERRLIRERIDEFVAQNPFIQDSPMLEYLQNGFASHHAGLLPGIKMLVESLFQLGLIKVVFATETLAAGINMPARTTVITSISKRSDDGHRLLTASEFLQMSGRAGRRGMDEVGYVVVVSSPYRGAKDAAKLASSAADPLNSQFTPTYGMVLNLLQRHTLEEAEYLISKSFSQFTAQRRLYPLNREIQQKTAEMQHYEDFKCPEEVDDTTFQHFLKSKALSMESTKRIQILKKQMKRFGAAPELIAEIQREQGKKESLQATMDSTACQRCELIGDHQKILDRVKRLEKQLKGIRTHFEREKSANWTQFSNIYKLLKEAEYLDAGDKPTPLGVLTSKIRAENEFLLAELLRKKVFSGLKPEAMAALLCALVNDSTRENLFSKLEVSPEAKQAMVTVSKEIKRVSKLQDKHGVEVGIHFNPIASGLVEAWTQEFPWDRLIAATNIDQGDLVRMIRRTADLLRQLARLPDAPDDVSRRARLALMMLYRDPIKELDITEETDQPASLVEKDAVTEDSEEENPAPGAETEITADP